MGSGIILIRGYMTEPVFEHYFEPVFGDKGINVGDRHFFGERSSEESALLALSGDVSKAVIYDAMSESVASIEKDNKGGDLQAMHLAKRPEWSHICPTFIDDNPKIIGLYEEDGTAAKFFGSVGLGYLAGEMEERISEAVNSAGSKLRGLGSKLSKF